VPGGPEYARVRTDVLRFALRTRGNAAPMSILWIILIVVLVLALLGFFSRGYW
jgi:hypothetical protein